MSNRQDKQREAELQPQRMEYAISEIEKLGFKVERLDDVKLRFIHKNSYVVFFPYSGWATGASISDGRGIKKLLSQLSK